MDTVERVSETSAVRLFFASDARAGARSPVTPADPRLEALGLTEAIASAFEARASGPPSTRGRTLELGRVSCVERGFATVLTADGEALLHVPKSLVRVASAAPVTGDWVAIDRERGAVELVLPRTTQFVRRAAGKRDEAQVVAANADVLLVLMGLDGDFNLRRLERYLTLASESGAEAVVLLTKASLSTDVDACLQAVREVAPGIRVHAIDVVSGLNADVPRSYLKPGVTLALLGSSGVGKSTLANFLMGEAVLRTREVRAHDDRGKHTTTRRELFVLEGGGIVIDTPGMRELALWGDSASLDGSFPDIAEMALGCRFSDCRHGSEPGCAVLAAVASGAVPASRLASYRALAAELEERERRARPSRPPRSRR